MIVITILLVVSIIIYLFLYYRKPSVFSSPDIAQMVFFRDYLILTMLSYLYVLHDDLYKHHYILHQISSPKVIEIAALFAFIFMFIFMFSYKILLATFSKNIQRYNININIKYLVFFLQLFSIFLIIYFIVISIYYSAGIIGMLKYDYFELVFLRHKLSSSSGVLQFHR